MQVSINFVWTVLTVDTLMRREGMEFYTYDLLHIYTVVLPQKEPNTNLFPGNHNLQLWTNQHPWTRMITDILDKDLYLDDFVWVSRNGSSKPGTMV